MHLDVAALQDISRHFGPVANAHALEAAAERYGLQLPGTFTTGKPSRIRQLLENVNGTDHVGQFLGEALRRTSVTEDNTRKLEAAFRTSPYAIRIQEGAYLLTLQQGLPQTVEDEKAIAFLQKHAPAKTIRYLMDAQGNLGRADWDGAISDSRLAIESLTLNGGFNNALQELASTSLIGRTVGGHPPQTYEFDLLKGFYGYLSTLGNHAAYSRSSPGQDQALMAVMMGQHAVRFLVATLLDAKTRGKVLSQWYSP